MPGDTVCISNNEPGKLLSWILRWFSVSPLHPVLISALPLCLPAHKLSNISFTSGLQNTNPPVSHRSFKDYLSTIKSHVPRSSIYLLSPPLHDFHLLVFDSDSPRLMSCDPIPTFGTLFGFTHRLLSLSVSFTPTTHTHMHTDNTPSTPLSVHPRVYPLITDLPSSLQSSSVPHRSSGESEWRRNIPLCVISKVNEREKVWKRAGWTYDNDQRETAGGRLIKDLSKHLERNLPTGEWMVICCCLHVLLLVVVKLCRWIQRIR